MAAQPKRLDFAVSVADDGVVTRRDDESWGFVEVDLRLDVALDSAPDAETVGELVSRAEHGCFVGSSLRPAPRYHWTVNGEEVA